MDGDCASYKDGDGYAASEPEHELVFETIPESPMINRTRNKFQKVIMTEAFMCSENF